MTDGPPSIRYVSDSTFRWSRKKHGKGFRFLDEEGNVLAAKEMDRIKKLGIPPAWTDVRICHKENGHIQAVGFDAKGRKQYIYHPVWTEYNQQHKFDRMVRFGEVLPTLRETVSGHMRQHNLTRERILATVVWLLENTFIRVGNKQYERDNKSYGLTTLRGKHVKVRGNTVKFRFKGKSGVYHDLAVTNKRVAATIKKCSELPGYELFQYLDEDYDRQTIDSSDVNEYMQSITGETLSAKDFRTWGGTTLAGDTLYQWGKPESEAEVKKALNHTVKEVSSHLRNTVNVCRKYYIHPKIVESYQKDLLIPHFEKIYKSKKYPVDGLSIEETAAWMLLK
ncbi:MAG TPA: DNA topoisomerase IB [Patescibacteria group bacterium]